MATLIAAVVLKSLTLSETRKTDFLRLAWHVMTASESELVQPVCLSYSWSMQYRK